MASCRGSGQLGQKCESWAQSRYGTLVGRCLLTAAIVLHSHQRLITLDGGFDVAAVAGAGLEHLRDELVGAAGAGLVQLDEGDGRGADDEQSSGEDKAKHLK